MIIFSHTRTPRLQYVVNFLAEYYNTPIRVVFDEEKYVADTDPHKINYSYHRLQPQEIWIHSHALLFESAVRPVKAECFDVKSWQNSGETFKAFFKAEGDFGFDMLAAIFFLLTRYEEYLPHKKDPYGRYSHENALAYQNDFLHLPIINIWLREFSVFAEQKIGLQLQLPSFSFLPTYDIDMAWSFRNKGMKRNAGALIKLFLTGKWGSFSQRLRVLRGKAADPYDAYEWIDALHARYQLQPIYFFLVAHSVGRFDKNIDTQNPAFRQLLHHISHHYQTGLHPSWASGDHPALLTREKSVLESITEKPVHFSRQHFIRFTLPETYRRLIALGITNDFSMGYGTINGFRASIATPFNWYDLKNESITPLRVQPFAYMEATSYYEQGMTPEEAAKEMEHYLKLVRQNNGTLITIWHNSFLGTDRQAEGWREVYEKFVASATAAK